jgi:hypothetical protein
LIRVLGTEVPRGAIAELALRFHRAGELGLALRLGMTIDRNHDELLLARHEYMPVLLMLEREPIPGLQDLPLLLIQANGGRQGGHRPKDQDEELGLATGDRRLGSLRRSQAAE